MCTHRISLSITRTCHKYYYSVHTGCRIYCKSEITYNCGNNGNKICNHGY